METAWLLSSTLGFFLDVFVYHTFSLFLKSVIKLCTCPEDWGCLLMPPRPARAPSQSFSQCTYYAAGPVDFVIGLHAPPRSVSCQLWYGP